MPRVKLPPGCYGLTMQDGTRYDPNHGSSVVEVSDTHASAIRRGWYGQTGVMVATEQHHIGTRTGRWCTNCRPARLWNAWNTTCRLCGAETHTEEQAA